MGKRRTAVTKQGPESTASLPKTGFFPFARYTSVVGVHTTLLAFTALFLPRTTLGVSPNLLNSYALPQTSVDKPQHPFLVPLTANPALTLVWVCVGAILCQAWWGGFVRKWWIEFELETALEGEVKERSRKDDRKLEDLKRAWVTTIIVSLGAFVTLVLFGAPISSHILQTYLLALLFSVLTMFAPAYTLSTPSFASDSASVVRRLTWVRLFAELSVHNPVERALVYPAVGTAIGCWVGAIPIALDWDRPWQAWPLTPTFGAILGYIVGSLLAFAVSSTRFIAEEHLETKARQEESRKDR